MIDTTKIKGLLFDYGGPIDSNGLHWAEVIWQGYEALQVPVSKECFRNAYVYGERTLGKNPIVQPHHTFLDMLRLKCDLQIQWLQQEGHLSTEVNPADEIATWCYAYARKAIDQARPILRQLAERYPLVLVSNFYGNIESVLHDFDLDGLFGSIVESAVVGVRKPNPAIFQMGVDRLGMQPEEVVVIGDSYDKDIVPAHNAGFKTVWFIGRGWTPDMPNGDAADWVITDLRELLLY